MNRTHAKGSKARPRPGAAKLNVALDSGIGEKSVQLSEALINGAIARNPTCLMLIMQHSKDAEWTQRCEKVARTWADRIEEELKQAAEAEQKASQNVVAAQTDQVGAATHAVL